MNTTKHSREITLERIEQTLIQKLSAAVREALRKGFKVPLERKVPITAPRPGTKCRAIWDFLDQAALSGTPVTLALVTTFAQDNGFNVNNARAEFYRWKAFASGHNSQANDRRTYQRRSAELISA